MKISGLQKMTLLDYPGKVACTIFLGGCNFRCPFCHNSELLDKDAPQSITEEELMTFLKKRLGLLDAVCISGGEPTLQPGLHDFISKIKEMGYLVKLDTNGSRPDILRQLIKEQLLDYVAMDVKNDEIHYARTCGLEHIELAPIKDSLVQLLTGSVDYELRTTVVEQLHDTECFTNIAALLQQLAPEHPCKRYYLQPFVDRDTVAYFNLTSPTRNKLEEYKKILEGTIPNVEIRGI